MDYRERITIEPGKRSGKPCIRGLRITVHDILDCLAGGMNEDEILADFPDLEREDIRAALAFATDRERRLVGPSAWRLSGWGSPLKLLFDQNLSPRLAPRLSDLYPDSAHVRDAGLASGDDEPVWRHAADEGFVIVTKDDDFRQRSFLRGAPPKVLWVRLGNCRTAERETVLRARIADVLTFGEDPHAALLVLTREP